MPSAVAEPPVTHPADLAWSLLGHDHWHVAADILDAVFRPNSRTAVKSCHASSKTFTAADVVILALMARYDVLTTAPTWEQVRTVLWGSIHRAISGATVDLSAWSVNQTEIVTPSGAKAIGLSTNEGVRFQGWHARPESALVVVFDEAPGVAPDIYEAVQGISAGGDVRWLLIGNPVLASGPFYELFSGDVPGWTRLTIDAFDTPNLEGLTLEELLALPEHELDQNVRPYLVTRRWVRDRYYEWGVDHPLWDSRVRGRFPRMGTDALIALTWAEQARDRPLRVDNRHTITAGIDVAGPGENETVLYARRGDDVVAFEAWAQPDPRQAVIKRLRGMVQSGLKHVNVDRAGIGWYFYVDLKEALEPHGVTVSGVNVGEPSDVLWEGGDKRYANLKAEGYWHLREKLSTGMLAGLRDQTTISQLTGITYTEPKGVVTIEKKEDATKRGVASPDRAEALMLAFLPPSRAVEQRAALQQATANTWTDVVRVAPSPEQTRPLTPAERFEYDKHQRGAGMGSRPAEKRW